MHATLLWLLACDATRLATDPATARDTGLPTLTGDGAPAFEVFSDQVVHAFAIELDDGAVAALSADPDDFVEGRFLYEGDVWDPVGVRLKGSASFQGIGGKPAWKIKFGEYVDGQRFHGLERLTLNNLVWDASMMAETLAYRTFREAGAPAPLTGYATVTLNGEPLGLYVIIESMDDDFVDRTWPGSEGGLWEMQRSCDFDADCGCYALQETGDNFDELGIYRPCIAVAAGTVDALRDAFDWDAWMAFQAVERVINHPDSYTYNLNNYFVYHDPLEDRVSLVPWGADSTFTYVYPPTDLTHACEPVYRDVLAGGPYGYLGGWCEADATCRAALAGEMARVATLLEDMDLAGLVETTRDRIRDAAHADPKVSYGPEHFEYQTECFRTWILQRPDEVRAWLEGW